MQTTLYLIRHSEKMRFHFPAALGDRIQPLSPRGERRAERLTQVPLLAGADAVYCSPFARTISTVKYLTERDHLEIHLEEDLRELEFGLGHHGSSQTPTAADMAAFEEFRKTQWEDVDSHMPGGESVRQCRARMARTVETILAWHPGQRILVASHGAAIGAYLSGLIDGVDDDFVFHIRQPDVFALLFAGTTFLSCRQLPLDQVFEPEGL